MFDFSKAQEITDEMIKLQNELKFQEAANLYLKTINQIQSSEFQLENQTEWIENLLDEQTTLILLGLS
jgi:polyhydroxyalkanoate synthesis regulator phasin